ncbi:Uncharacterized protein TCM_001375 [Theobroma cacao]|uniref:Uncharacterized protein n=1 Tax=Theobroma cacao TaxID=3641 RepID=A0A061DK68_THECC|nr:Uncharacterized protein TCM_001375 [Theobroma cacao]
MVEHCQSSQRNMAYMVDKIFTRVLAEEREVEPMADPGQLVLRLFFWNLCSIQQEPKLAQIAETDRSYMEQGNNICPSF